MSERETTDIDPLLAMREAAAQAIWRRNWVGRAIPWDAADLRDRMRCLATADAALIAGLRTLTEDWPSLRELVSALEREARHG